MGNEKLKIAGVTFDSRLFVGTGKFSSGYTWGQVIEYSGTEMVTVAMKRANPKEESRDSILPYIQRTNVRLLPNTSGVRDAKEAIFVAQMAREALKTNWLKLEIHPDPKYLMPDPVETLKATEELAKDGFIILPYCHADPVLCKKLEDAGGCELPLGRVLVRVPEQAEPPVRLAPLLRRAPGGGAQLARHARDRLVDPDLFRSDCLVFAPGTLNVVVPGGGSGRRPGRHGGRRLRWKPSGFRLWPLGRLGLPRLP